jgi:signal transduction histidine kinase
MRSVYARIMLWCFATLLISLQAFSIVSRVVQNRAMGNGGPMARFDNLILKQAAEAYESGGVDQLKRYLQKVSSITGMQRYLCDSAGKDLAGGADLSSLLSRGMIRPSAFVIALPWRPPGRIPITAASPEGHYRLITIAEPPFAVSILIPYYLLILATVALVCWALAFSIASPLHELARRVERFGRGELSLRSDSRRRDEIGELARSFDRMAERIGTLLVSERRLLQDVSHELRSPLARMSFAAELARKSENRDAAIDRIKTDIKRLKDLISGLLEVTRGEGDPLACKFDRFCLATLIREIAVDSFIEADARGCRIGVNVAKEPTLAGDRELLRRAFENIVRNAIRYAPAGSAVVINIGIVGDRSVTTIRDYGEGVPEEALSKLIDPFFRVDDSRTTSTGGVGLGLAIAERAVRLHEGRLHLSNAQPGLLVSVELPGASRVAGQSATRTSA